MPYGMFGEDIGVLIPRELTDINNEITAPTATDILQTIDKAWLAGNPYSESHVSKDRYVVHIMMRSFQMTRQAAKSLLKDWLRNGMVASQIRDQHSKKRGLRVLNWPT